MLSSSLLAVAVATACLLLADVATSAESLSKEERLAQMKKLQAALAAHEAALARAGGDVDDVRARREAQDKPRMVVNAGSLSFKVKNGKRIGFQIGTDEVVQFDELAKTDQTLGLLIQSVYKSGMSTGQLGADVTKLGKDIDFLQGNMSVATFDAKLSAAVGEFGQKLTPLEARIKSMEGKIATSIKPLDDRIKNLEAVSDAAYWYDNHVEDGEDPGTTYVNPGSRPYLKLTGVGLQTRYHPDANGQLKCAFIVKGKKDLQSAGSIKAKVSSSGSYYHVECQVPAYDKGIVVEVKLYEHDGTLIPFRGGPGCNQFTLEPLYTDTILVSKYPLKPEYQVKGTFEVGSTYKCEFKGTNGNVISRTSKATSKSTLQCGLGPTQAITDNVDENGEGTLLLLIYSGDTLLKGTSRAKNVKYYICDTAQGSSFDCTTTCPSSSDADAGQAEFTGIGTFKWKAPFCGFVSVMAVGGGSGGGYTWSSGGGGGGGLAYLKRHAVVKGNAYTVVVGKGGSCTTNAGNSHASDGGNSYFVSASVCQGYGGGQGGPNAESSSPGYGGGYKGDGGGRGGRGGRSNHYGGGGAGGYAGRGGDAANCGNGNRNCDAPQGSGGGGGGGYYSSTWGTPAGGGVGLKGIGESGRGDYQQGSTGGSDGAPGRGGEQGGNDGRPRCQINGGIYGGGGGGAGTSSGGGPGGSGAVRIIWGGGRAYPTGGSDL